MERESEGQPEEWGEEGGPAQGAPGEIQADGSYERTGDLISPVQGLDVSGDEQSPPRQGAGCGLVFIGGALLLLALFVVKCSGDF